MHKKLNNWIKKSEKALREHFKEVLTEKLLEDIAKNARAEGGDMTCVATSVKIISYIV